MGSIPFSFVRNFEAMRSWTKPKEVYIEKTKLDYKLRQQKISVYLFVFVTEIETQHKDHFKLCNVKLFVKELTWSLKTEEKWNEWVALIDIDKVKWMCVGFCCCWVCFNVQPSWQWLSMGLTRGFLFGGSKWFVFVVGTQDSNIVATGLYVSIHLIW